MPAPTVLPQEIVAISQYCVDAVSLSFTTYLAGLIIRHSLASHEVRLSADLMLLLAVDSMPKALEFSPQLPSPFCFLL
jgi:hypothetical protein